MVIRIVKNDQKGLSELSLTLYHWKGRNGTSQTSWVPGSSKKDTKESPQSSWELRLLKMDKRITWTLFDIKNVEKYRNRSPQQFLGIRITEKDGEITVQCHGCLS